MLESFGFPDTYCRMVHTLLADANASVEVNGLRSDNFGLSRSIRQGCPLVPTLFTLATDALHYMLKANELSPRVKGITLPNKEEVANIQFADDSTVLLVLEEDNLVALLENIDIFCKASGSKIALHKSIMLGWDCSPPSWFSKFDLMWGGPNQIVRYLGIPFSVSPNLKEMWEWVKNKIDKKLAKWNRNFLSLAGRFQVCRKVLSSFSIYYSSL